MNNLTKVSELVKALSTCDQIQIGSDFYRVDWANPDYMTLEEDHKEETCIITTCDEYFSFVELYDHAIDGDLQLAELRNTYKS